MPEEIIVAIIGVETVYGRQTGRWRVIDALTTLAFDYPPRAPYSSAASWSSTCCSRATQGIDVFSVRGSYAGAIGIPQFMPGSYRRFAVDFDGDGRADLRGNSCGRDRQRRQLPASSTAGSAGERSCSPPKCRRRVSRRTRTASRPDRRWTIEELAGRASRASGGRADLRRHRSR